MNNNEENPNEVTNVAPEKSAELFLKAVLAEYNRLNNEILQHFKNINYIIAVLISGSVTILGFYSVLGVLSFLLLPIFVSGCAFLVLSETNIILLLGKYIREEIEDRRLSRLFPNDSPLRWEKHYHEHYRNRNKLLYGVIFIFSLITCVGCLAIVPLEFLTELSTNIIYLLTYVFGFLVLAVYSIYFLFLMTRQ